MTPGASWERQEGHMGGRHNRFPLLWNDFGFQKGGLIGPKNLGDFWVFSLIFNGILMPNWGFNYSKMAKYRFLIDSNTFLTILGTAKISNFFGPVVDPGTPYLS